MQGFSEQKTTQILLPKPALTSLMFGAICRDTRGSKLNREQRFNFFPASPLCTITIVWEGELFVVSDVGEISASPLPDLFISGPAGDPTFSWSSGAVNVMTICLYPDAWLKFTGTSATKISSRAVAADKVLSEQVLAIFRSAGDLNNSVDAFEHIQSELTQIWQHPGMKIRSAPNLIKDWARSLIVRVAMSGFGKSSRQLQRQIKNWSGQSKRDLQNQIRLEMLFERTRKYPDGGNLAELSISSGYSDQSHMGREVRRYTGFSPAQINRLIETDERFWCYRLLGEQY